MALNRICNYLVFMFASVAQAFITGYSFMLPATAFSLFTVFLFNQDMTYIDYLSEVYNRRYLELALERKIGQARANRSFSAVMTDLDIFRDINNSFGYITGDDELRVTAKLLLQCAGKKGLVARYGGDEYFLLLDSDNREELEETAESIYRAFEKFNAESAKPYKLTINLGYAVYDPAST